jgi:hypothetical protein
MISKRTFDEFVAPYYRQLLPRLQERQIPLIMDTDGDVTLLVPWLKELGIAGVLPLERQAGVDGLKLRQQFPDFLFIGHFDKMTMNRGEQAMRAEFERLLPMMRAGGFIPSVDHQTPPGVSLDQYRSYLRLLDEYTAMTGRTPGTPGATHLQHVSAMNTKTRQGTRAVWAGEEEHLLGATQVPVVLSAAFGYKDIEEWLKVARGKAEGHIYTRNSNPTIHV